MLAFHALWIAADMDKLWCNPYIPYRWFEGFICLLLCLSHPSGVWQLRCVALLLVLVVH